jgi:acetyl esterase
VFTTDPVLVNERIYGVADLHPQLRAYVDRAAASPPAWEVTLDQLRAGPDAETAEIWGGGDYVDTVEERMIGGRGGPLGLRVYRPQSDEPLPALLWLHGGGWVVGSLESHDPVCRYLASRTPCCVVAVDYRLAPEHPFPAGLDDAWAATEWTFREAAAIGADASRVAVGGDSAGGNLAAVIALRARDRAVPLALQVLVYPVTDFDLDTESYREHGTGLNLSRAKMEWYWRQYLDGADGLHRDASPLRAEDPAGLAPAVVITAEHDPLRSEGDAYAARLAEAGVSVAHTGYDGMIHGFIRMPALVEEALHALDEVVAALRRL